MGRLTSPAPRRYNSTFGARRRVGGLLASAIGLGGPAPARRPWRRCIEVGNGDHPAGMMGRHVIVALLGAARPEGWEFIERLLLAAQHQEGLRQVDPASPSTRRTRTPSTGCSPWFSTTSCSASPPPSARPGCGSASTPTSRRSPWRNSAFARLPPIGRTRRSARPRSASGDPWDVYVALCAGGTRDVTTTLGEVKTLAAAPAEELRAVAVRYAAATGLANGQELLTAVVDDPDIRVASLAASVLDDHALRRPGAFDALARLAGPAAPMAREAPPLGVEQAPVTLSRAATAALLVRSLGDRPVADLLPWLPVMDSGGRAGVARAHRRPLQHHGTPPGADRPSSVRSVISLLSDRSSQVRGIAIKALTKTRLPPSEAAAVEALLTRAATDIRRGALTMLASLPPDAARASAARLAASKDKRQRDAPPVELFREIGGKPRHGAVGEPGPVSSRLF